ncbi:tRNA lysidine(34) synthetase TilS [Bacillus sp. V2I10]|uniref:tRNA lysidine(34) synthetase TilS n=1 Tax=Bacillus sp. V2I10 TaxID=3042276 RepID=UPI00278889F9|nr:tRNA lysidine(34) synthetase TilS [Bacillus sp. V2I10]MDQ0856794.1 tRNA(Ile)-lysidine synthase [Bacillus sp. V2I10]
MLERFRTFLNVNDINDATVVIGVSGGPDSLALLHLFMRFQQAYQLKIIAAHVDHMFRGSQSEEEMEFVKHYCRSNGVPCEAVQLNVPDFAREHPEMSSQNAARECRYAFYSKVMEKYDGNFLALGHHGDDQVETILMRMTRGGMGASIAGIPEIRDFDSGKIIRPFLSFTKEQILTYCLDQKLAPRFDPSNEKLDYTRNRFRKHILPFLKEENPKVHERFQFFSRTFREDEQFLQELTKEKLNTVLKRKEKNEIELNIEMFKTLPMPLQRRGIQLILNYLYEDIPSSLSSIHIESLQSLLSQKHPSGSLDYPDGLKVIKSYQTCLFTFEQNTDQSYEMQVQIPSSTALPNGYILTCEIADRSPDDLSGNHVFVMPYSSLNKPLLIRTRRQGDKIKLKGMNGTKKVKDIFIDAKVPINKRNSWPVLEDGSGNILWLPGLKKSSFEEYGLSEGDCVVLEYKEQ